MRTKHLPLLAVWFWLVAPGVLAGPAARAEPSASLDLQSYTSELERWSAVASRLRAHPEEARALRMQLPDYWSVTVEEQRFPVSTRPLQAALDQLIREPHSGAAAAQQLSAHVESMLQDARALPRASVRDDRATRAKLEDILRRREFRFVRAPNESETFWDRLVARLFEWIIKLLSRAGGHPSLINFLLWGIVFAFGLVFLVWLVHTLTHASYGHAAAPREQGVPTTWIDGVQQARSAAARGDYREAIRLIYGTAVHRLGEAGVWQVDPSRTHREYVRLLPADSRQRQPLVAIATCFEHVWYGRTQASAGDYEAALAELESLP